MIALDNGDKIRGDASAATVVDYTLHGVDNNAIKQMADGQLAAAIGDLYTADSTDVVSSIILVNTDSSARTVNLYITPSGGSARRLIPKNMSLGISYCLITDGKTVNVYDASGNLQQTVTVVAHALGGSSHDADTLSNLNAKVSDATLVDATAISSEIDGDISTHAGLSDPHTGYRLESADHSHQTTGAQAGKIDHGAALNGLGDDDHTQYIKDAEFTAADEIIVGTGAGTFGQVALGASQFLAKKSTGVATNVTAAQARTILNVADGATAYVDASAVSAVEAAGLTFDENKGIILDALLSGDGKWSGFTEAGTAGVTMAVGDLVYLSVADTRWELADADAVATAFGKLGICILAANDGAATNVLLWGKVRSSVFPVFTVGAPVHVGTTAGDVQVAAPTGTDKIVRIIGYGNTAEDLMFCPDNTYIKLA